MRARQRFANWLYWRLTSVASRKPDFIIGSDDDPYMERWWVIPRNRIFNVYLHHFLHSDDDRALHDHPWWNCSFLLKGSYVEHTIASGGVNIRTRYHIGDIKFRRAKAAHRVELTHGPCWSLFITGPIMRSWGFHCPKGWRDWKVFTDTRDYGKIGIGCGEHGDAVTDANSNPRLDLVNHLKAKTPTTYEAAMALVAERDREIADYTPGHGEVVVAGRRRQHNRRSLGADLGPAPNTNPEQHGGSSA